jgi:hypothetical protein
MSEAFMELHDEEEVLAVLDVQSTQLIMFDNEYCVYRYADEPASDVMVDIDPDLLQNMWGDGQIRGHALEYGMSYKAHRGG